jgi:hypothetical protein
MVEDRQLRLAQFASQREHNWEAALLRDREQLMCGSVFGVTRGVLAGKQPRTADSTIILLPLSITNFDSIQQHRPCFCIMSPVHVCGTHDTAGSCSCSTRLLPQRAPTLHVRWPGAGSKQGRSRLEILPAALRCS